MRVFDMLKAGQVNEVKIFCIDLVGMCYTSLGQKPDKEQMKGMAQLLYNDLITYHSNLTLDEINFIKQWHIGDVTAIDGYEFSEIRGMLLEEVVYSESQYLDQASLMISVNAELDSGGSGFSWGSDPPLEFIVDNGPGFQGTWEGRFVGTFVEGKPFKFEAIVFGTGDFAPDIIIPDFDFFLCADNG